MKTHEKLLERLDTARMSRSIVPLAFILGIGTIVGNLIGTLIMALTGVGIPVAIMMGTIGLVAAPAWALLCGGWFSRMGTSKLSKALNVTHLSDSHPITLRVQEFAAKLNLPPVKSVGWYPGNEINAFAAGLSKDNAMVCFTEGAVKKLSRDELDAVIGHELAHIANGDMKRMTYAKGVQNSLTWMLIFNKAKRFARWLFTFISEAAIMKLSRSREYPADAVGAVLAGPENMISALQKIDQDDCRSPRSQRDAANIMFFPNPANRIFATHPTTADRIRKLEKLTYVRRLPFKGGVSLSERESSENTDNFIYPKRELLRSINIYSVIATVITFFIGFYAGQGLFALGINVFTILLSLIPAVIIGAFCASKFETHKVMPFFSGFLLFIGINSALGAVINFAVLVLLYGVSMGYAGMTLILSVLISLPFLGAGHFLLSRYYRERMES